MGKGSGKGRDDDSIVGSCMGSFPFCFAFLCWGAYWVTYKKYADFDNDALKTWVEAPAGCQILNRRVFELGSQNGNKAKYKVKLKVQVNANVTGYDTWFATAYRWPSWTNKGFPAHELCPTV